MSTQTGQKNQQKIAAIRTLTREPVDLAIFCHGSILPILMLLVLMILTGPAFGASEAGPFSSAQTQNSPPQKSSYRVAQNYNSVGNWQQEAFAAIDMQKRLDKLARQQKKHTLRSEKKQRATRRRKALARPNLKKTIIKKTKKRRVANKNRRRTDKIVREPAKLQRCLQVAGYFKGVITGRLDDGTLLAYLAFREDKKLLHRPNNLYDPVIQKALFGMCPDDKLANLNQMIASAMGRKPTNVAAQTTPNKEPKATKLAKSVELTVNRSTAPLTTASIGVSKKQARLPNVEKSTSVKIDKSKRSQTVAKTPIVPTIQTPQKAAKANKKQPVAKSAMTAVVNSPKNRATIEKTFANDVLAATDNIARSKSSSAKPQTLARLDAKDLTGASSSFAPKRAVPANNMRTTPRTSTRVASAANRSTSPFSKPLSISDLAKVNPVSPNTCSPQKHAPVVAMSTVPVQSATRKASPVRTASAYEAYMYDDAPLITGSISSPSASFKNPIVKSFKKRARLVQTDQPQKSCLPQDLYNMLATAHGRKSQVSVCKTDCLPAPKSFSQGQIELFAEQYNINWCGTGCLGIADPLPLAEVMKIEREARVHVCMNPQLTLVPSPRRGRQKASIDELFRGLPGGYGNADNIAVLIGNRNYAKNLEINEAAQANIAAMKALLIDQLGYSADNIMVLSDAKRSDMVRLFGRRGDVSGALQQRLKSNPDAQLMIYYSGHASSSGLGLNNHLLPVDAVRGREDESAYSLSVLYDNLRELDARTTQLFLETGFNTDRSSRIQAPNIAERRVNVAPIVPVRGLAVFTAATGDQKPLIDHETGIGLFTRYLISGLAGAADQRPIGNGDRIIDSVELYVHLAGNVRLAARKTLGLRQNPTFARSDNLFLSQLSRKPKR